MPAIPLTPFWFGTTKADADAAFAHFIGTALPQFGDYQDAMLGQEKFLYHVVVSLYLNCGLLDPLEMCRAVEAEYRAGRAPLNAAEGFIRQIIGWREYVRGIYWLKMPDYAQGNALGAVRPLPDFYWDFVARHHERSKANPRMGQMVRTWDKFSAERQAEIKGDAALFLRTL